MSGLLFPETLPPPTQAGYGDAFDVSSTRAEFEVGTPRKRRQYSAAPRVVDLSWDFSRSQYDIFDDWLTDTAANGAALFDIFLDGLWWETNFLSTPPYSVAVDTTGARWTVTAKLLLGVGVNSGMPVRANTVTLSARLGGVVLATSTLLRNADFTARLAGTVRATAGITAITPMTAQLAGRVVARGEFAHTATLAGSIAARS